MPGHANTCLALSVAGMLVVAGDDVDVITLHEPPQYRPAVGVITRRLMVLWNGDARNRAIERTRTTVNLATCFAQC